jgi:hypothetical protein
MLEVDGVERSVRALDLTITRTCRWKSKWIRLAGEGFYNWQTNKANFPAGARLTSTPWTSDFSDWDDYTVADVKPEQCLTVTFSVFRSPHFIEEQVPDFDSQ